MRKRGTRWFTLVAPLGLLILGATQGYADLTCNTNSQTGCLYCYGVNDQGLCCGITDCGDGNLGGGCGVCQIAKAEKAQPKVLVARLLAKDPAVANAIKYLR
jgi:hypothetical protein